jgi:hypothetical protein
LPDIFLSDLEMNMSFTMPLVGRLRLLAAPFAASQSGGFIASHLQSAQQRKACFAQHIAIYLAHVACGMRVTEVARAFERDPATIRYACARIEDARDDLFFDKGLTALEQEARAAARALDIKLAPLGGDHDQG